MIGHGGMPVGACDDVAREVHTGPNSGAISRQLVDYRMG